MGSVHTKYPELFLDLLSVCFRREVQVRIIILLHVCFDHCELLIGNHSLDRR